MHFLICIFSVWLRHHAKKTDVFVDQQKIHITLWHCMPIENETTIIYLNFCLFLVLGGNIEQLLKIHDGWTVNPSPKKDNIPIAFVRKQSYFCLMFRTRTSGIDEWYSGKFDDLVSHFNFGNFRIYSSAISISQDSWVIFKKRRVKMADAAALESKQNFDLFRGGFFPELICISI